MNPRILKLKESFQSKGLDAFLVTNDVNILYLTNFPASESWLLVTRRGSFYITDFRYVLEAKKGLRGVDVYRYQKSLAEGGFSLVKQLKIKRLGFDSRHLSHASYQKLNKMSCGQVKLVSAHGLAEHIREIKSENEISLIRKALKLNLDAYRYLKGVIRPGITEREVFLKLEAFVKKHKARFSFSPIIASGPNSCFPHARVTDRKVKKDDLVLVDMGMDIDGYKSDLTRVFFLGRIPQLVKRICVDVKEAQRLAIEKIKANVPAHDVDFQARNHLKKKKLGQYFGHSLGHGVGLEIHESPSLSQMSSAILKEGMVITVEPAVYLPNRFGIRIEDMVLVTKNGCEVISRSEDVDQVCP